MNRASYSKSRARGLRSLALVAALLGVGAGLLFLTKPGGEFTSRRDLPNVILITADDLGWKELSSYGNRNLSTPNIDRLAAEGVRFSHAFVAASSCSPSRASLITGQYPHTHGVTGLAHRYPTRSLSPFHQTLPKLLKKESFNTALQGKWHVSPYLPTSWYGYQERLSGILASGFQIHDSKEAVDFIRRNRGNRFYLELNFMQNHRDEDGAFHLDPGYPVDPDEIRVPEYWTLPDWPEIRQDIAGYYSQTMKMDQLVGEILQALDELRLAENTLVIFVSDNGAPYPGNKMTLYDRGIGTPLLMRWPQRLAPKRVLDQHVTTLDIMPTILEASGIAVPGDLQGRSLLGVLQDGSGPEGDRAIFGEMTHHVHYLPTRAVRTRRWKYIRNFSDIAAGLDQNARDDWAHRLCELSNQPWKRARAKEELYDLEGDPHEQTNLVGDEEHEPRLEKMRTLLRQHMLATQDPYLDRPFTHDYDAERYRRHD